MMRRPSCTCLAIFSTLMIGLIACAASSFAAPPTGAKDVHPGPAVVKAPPSKIDSTPLSHEAVTSSPANDSKDSTTTLETPRVAMALAAVIALILLLRFGARRFLDLPGGQRSTGAVQVLSRTVLAPRQHVVLLKVGKRIIVVGDSGGQMSSLGDIADPDEVASLVGHIREEKLTVSAKAFGSLFRRAKDDLEEAPETESHSPAPISDQFAEAPAEDPELTSTREEISDLMQKVRGLSRQFNGS